MGKNSPGPMAAIDEAHAIIDQCFDCESRAEIEAKEFNGMGPLARRIFLIWKRDPKVEAAMVRVARYAIARCCGSDAGIPRAEDVVADFLKTDGMLFDD